MTLEDKRKIASRKKAVQEAKNAMLGISAIAYLVVRAMVKD